MMFNNKKFEVLKYGTNDELKEYDYKAGNEVIEAKGTLRDLGVWMSNVSDFKEHVNRTTRSTRKMGGWILRTFKTRNPEHLLPLWKTLVVSNMEYVCQLWSPHKINEIEELEQVQRVFTRKLIGDSLNYWERLNSLNLYF